MNYSHKSPCISWKAKAAEFLQQSKQDHLLEELIYDESSDSLLVHSLRTCIVSALSRPLLLSNPFKIFQRCAFSELMSGLKSARAIVVGWGGLMDTFIKDYRIASLHVTDLLYGTKLWRQRIDEETRLRRVQNTNKKFTVSDGSDFEERIVGCDICAITGSSLSNNTLKGLLDAASYCQRVILQGQSASIYPEYLFQEGLVNFISTTIKPNNMLEVARNNSGAFSKLVEGGLPYIDLRPSGSCVTKAFTGKGNYETA